MKFWISKYALSGGITEHDAKVEDGRAYPGVPFASYVFFNMGRDAHDTRDAAIARAEEMRNKKIKSLKRQLKKLEEMRFY